jgi:hypothetical protein
MQLNKETGAYVYKLVAMKEIIGQPVKYGYSALYAYQPLPQLLAVN